MEIIKGNPEKIGIENDGRIYAAIDLKSFYASVECAEFGLDPLHTNLVVADTSRTEKTICLAVSPSLKAYGISGRARLFEVVQKVKVINRERLKNALLHRFVGGSSDDRELEKDRNLKLDFIAAKPRMALYMEYSTRIYNIYLRHISQDDIHVYSIDEVFMDITGYVKKTKKSPEEFVRMLIKEVLDETGITATAGIGSNMYLCKIAMDIVAKHMEPDENGVRIALLDEKEFRRALWSHTPITDFWRIGRGTAARLEKLGIYTVGDIALASVRPMGVFPNEETLYREFGVNAELLIDHAWGYEPCGIKEIKSYRPSSNSISTGQVLPTPYSYGKAEIVVREMADMLSLDLVEKGVVCDRVNLYISYDASACPPGYSGKKEPDYYGRTGPAAVHGGENLDPPTSSSSRIISAILKIFKDKVDKNLFVRRINISAENIKPERYAVTERTEQIDLFSDASKRQRDEEEEKKRLKREKDIQKTVIGIKKKFGKNAILKGMNLEEGATARERNSQIGGHKA